MAAIWPCRRELATESPALAAQSGPQTNPTGATRLRRWTAALGAHAVWESPTAVGAVAALLPSAGGAFRCSDGAPALVAGPGSGLNGRTTRSGGSTRDARGLRITPPRGPGPGSGCCAEGPSISQ